MPAIRIRYLVEKPGRSGPRFFWQPTKELRARGWLGRRLSADRAAAIAEAERLNAELDAWRAGEAPVPLFQAARRRKGATVDQGVYVIGSQRGMQKIGVAARPELRLAQLQTASGLRLELHLFVRGAGLDAFELERLAHGHLAARRREGEWFDVTPGQAIDAVCRLLARAAAANRLRSLLGPGVGQFGGEAGTPELDSPAANAG